MASTDEKQKTADARKKEPTTYGAVINVKVPPTMFRKIDKEAKRRCTTKANIVREHLERAYG